MNSPLGFIILSFAVIVSEVWGSIYFTYLCETKAEVIIHCTCHFNKRNALTCFSCDLIPFPRDCKTVVKCGEHEECFVDKIVTHDGNSYFNTGCRDKQMCAVSGGKRSNMELLDKRQGSFQTTNCSTCCSSEHCNSGGCGAPALPPKEQRGPICYTCAMMRDPTHCNQVNLCNRDALCEVLRTPHPTFDVTYTAKCGTKALCDRLNVMSNGFGRRFSDSEVEKRGFSLCFRCCAGDLCNLGCDAVNVTTTTTTITTAPMSSSVHTYPTKR